MAGTSEKTMGQRAVRAESLYTLVKGEKGYAPENNPLITKAAWGAFVGDVKSLNGQVAQLKQPYQDAVNLREDLYHGVQGLKARARQVRDLLGSYQGGTESAAYQAVQKLVQQLDNYRPGSKKDATPVQGLTEEEIKEARSTAMTSYGSMLQVGRDLVGILRALGVGYKTSNPLLTVAELETLIQQMDNQNPAIDEAFKPYNDVLKARYALYEGPEGMRVRMAATKKYIAGDLGGKKTDLYKEALKRKY